MSRERVLTDEQWSRIEPLMPWSDEQKSRPFRGRRQAGGRGHHLWRDLPASFGAWQTVWKRQHRFAIDGTWGRIHARLLAEADVGGDPD